MPRQFKVATIQSRKFKVALELGLEFESDFELSQNPRLCTRFCKISVFYIFKLYVFHEFISCSQISYSLYI